MREPGRTAAFRDYVAADRGRLLRTARLLTAGDEHLAEDLVQTTLTRLYVAWPRVTRADGPGPYARKVLVNAFIDETRRPWRRRELATAVPPERVAAEPVPTGLPADSAVLAGLAQLPPRQRAVVVLRFLLDLDVQATSRALDCSEALSKIVVVPLDHPVSGATSLAVQYPPGIGWTDSEAISFASAVRVLSTAKDPKG